SKSSIDEEPTTNPTSSLESSSSVNQCSQLIKPVSSIQPFIDKEQQPLLIDFSQNEGTIKLHDDIPLEDCKQGFFLELDTLAYWGKEVYPFCHNIDEEPK
ncbi:hypothetical protein KI387_044454, partial [Taxus chinensis]